MVTDIDKCQVLVILIILATWGQAQNIMFCEPFYTASIDRWSPVENFAEVTRTCNFSVHYTSNSTYVCACSVLLVLSHMTQNSLVHILLCLFFRTDTWSNWGPILRAAVTRTQTLSSSTWAMIRNVGSFFNFYSNAF